MFIDVAKIFVKGGNGGHGAVAFRREKYEPAGGPAGGDGGDGGSVILEVDRNIRTLMDFRYSRHHKAPNGEDGKSKMQYGKKGQDLILKVPQGTIIRDAETNAIIADLTEDGTTYVIAKGGRGGKGNMKFTTSTRQAPRFAEGGSKGEERWIVLELKLLADVGLVGFPNVGKSTLLSVMTDAKPKIADYHFTTLTPNLGVVEIEGGKSFVIADIPGLIEGAHTGIGLGHDFLRHIERTRVIVHLVDVSGQEGRDPVEDFIKINQELEKYDARLASRPQIVVGNKMDILGEGDGFDRLEKEVSKLGYELYPISAATRQGIKELKYGIWNKLQEAGEIEPTIEIVEENKTYELKEKKDDIIVRKENEQYFVEGDFVEKLLNSTNFDDLDSIRYFQRMIKKRGVVDKLKELGIKNEEIVNICGYEFEFFD
ncbi:GTP-binding protein [Proteiniborus ethanoligenes]|uniref:GTPase Obg n=1 Tax=Proteiniborus ethanoligenes TaxID=415015 RepID=A0A1H3S8S8_9FIRM|nr:GTPase ObgE [Proteiniborus ethanoligenes]TAH62059.1 MAG: GTPase ObgE [Gottschalkiaceae bacterium]SDZ34372.1 GTP-binding protein [Proteiniborus ethanoligenes]